MFNAKALLLLLLSIAIGGGAAVFAQRWLQEQQGDTVAEDNTVEVIVAAREIPYAQPIEELHLRTVKWPADAVPEGIYHDKAELIGKIAAQKVLPGDLLVAGRVVEKLEGSRLSALIAPHKRAITVRVNDVAGVAGFLLPGNRVDVLATRMDRDRRAATRTLLQNIKVLAIDQKANPDKDDPIVVRAVTLEADIDEASQLAAATEEGSIQLVLRNPDDLAIRVEEEPKKVITRQAPRDTSQDITIIRGTSVQNSKVKL